MRFHQSTVQGPVQVRTGRPLRRPLRRANGVELSRLYLTRSMGGSPMGSRPGMVGAVIERQILNHLLWNKLEKYMMNSKSGAISRLEHHLAKSADSFNRYIR